MRLPGGVGRKQNRHMAEIRAIMIWPKCCYRGGQTAAREPRVVFGSLSTSLLTDVVFVCNDVVLGCVTCSASRSVCGRWKDTHA